MSENLRVQIVAALDALEARVEHLSDLSLDQYADAVMAVVGPELDRLRAEVERWRGAWDGINREWAVDQRRANTAEAEVTRLRAEVERLSSGRVSNAEKERDDALALIERMSSLDGAADDAGPANAWPANPGEFAARWNALDDAARAWWLAAAVEAMSTIDGVTWRLRAAEAERDVLRARLAKVAGLLGEVWDDGNATGLDGWVGPGRGTDPVDDEAVRARERSIERALASVPEPSDSEPAPDADREAGERCTCGAPDAYALTPGETIVHRRDGEPCYIAQSVDGASQPPVIREAGER